MVVDVETKVEEDNFGLKQVEIGAVMRFFNGQVFATVKWVIFPHFFFCFALFLIGLA